MHFQDTSLFQKYLNANNYFHVLTRDIRQVRFCELKLVLSSSEF